MYVPVIILNISKHISSSLCEGIRKGVVGDIGFQDVVFQLSEVSIVKGGIGVEQVVLSNIHVEIFKFVK